MLQGRSLTLVSENDTEAIATRWSHIRRFLGINNSTGSVDHDYLRWHFATMNASLPSADMAAACDEWADFFEWRLTQRAAELAADRVKHHLVEEWTDDMAYCCRRAAARARGQDPGDWVPLRVRRPDLAAEGRAIVAEIIASLDACPQPADTPVPPSAQGRIAM